MTIFSKDALKEQHILITGATGGIGYETAKACAAAGAHLTITGRNEDKLSLLKGECEELSPLSNVFLFSADLDDADDRQSLIDAAISENGPITGLVNGAGIAGGASLDELDEQDLRRIMELNFTSTVLITQAVYREMRKTNGGAVVNVSSLSGLRGTARNSAYAGSKFALIGFTQSFAVEAIEHGIRVNAVCPGYVDTKMGRDSIERKGEISGRSYEEQLKAAKAGIPSGRISTPEEVAQTILFLLINAAGNIVGESIKISGGSVM
ncbi:SDR family NAD(P)-dependent oxidoreductase [Bacillus sp. SJS]|uniref:SDR family NAD(P)-dependent oxidoreductase n=1 Tax=Bacillus sp. SJS TaxID=1423321 RepID=UPI0004DD0DD2|nr:SDR family oxidoreductase [Bacillus sp. SJS]KZZ84065.1 short-chain dehydrogenase [Bacillus sp. SJS]